MPIYEYQCEACGHRLEAFQKISEEPLRDCPVCNKPALQKLVSAAGFQLKGSGWYVTDFRDGGRKKAEEGSKSAAAADGGSKEQKSADKAAAGGEATTKTVKTSEPKS